MAAKLDKGKSRRRFLTAAAGTAAGAAAMVAMPNVSRAQTVTLKVQGAWGAKDIFNEFAEDFIKRVNDMAGGRLKLDYLLGGSVVKPFSLHDAVHSGVLDGGHTVAAYWYGKHKAASLFGSAPAWGWDANQMLGWYYYGGGEALYTELMDKVLGLNIAGFLSGPMPTQPLGWFKQPVESAERFRGLKYRTVGLAADLMQAMGAAVTQLPGGEIIPAMDRGVIDAFEYNNPTSDRRFGAQDVAKVYMMGSYHQPMEAFEIIFNKTKFNTLADEQKAIIRHSAEAASADMSWKAQDNYSKDLQALIETDRVSVVRTPKSILQAQLDAWDKILPTLTQDPFFKKCVESQRAWVKRVVFYDLMNRQDQELAYEHFHGKLG
ncbi:MAG: TRAP transporter substrate-binding protein [Alphaproteobacteria bacterium]|nr:TRAP transporter substrate-binding protein [Alphaproteobacteria bacterium]MBF0393461.1 TRAP transporter substrate-binding protein [Alphaproteobacteria bacterium]